LSIRCNRDHDFHPAGRELGCIVFLAVRAPGRGDDRVELAQVVDLDEIGARPADEGVVARPADQGVVAVAAGEDVVARAGITGITGLR